MKLVILVRTDGHGPRQLAAQVAHAAVQAALNCFGTPDCAVWLNEGQPKIVLRVDSEAELRRITEAAKRASLPVLVVSDAGRTQLPAGTPTCGAIGPADGHQIDVVTGDLSLL